MADSDAKARAAQAATAAAGGDAPIANANATMHNPHPEEHNNSRVLGAPIARSGVFPPSAGGSTFQPPMRVRSTPAESNAEHDKNGAPSAAKGGPSNSAFKATAAFQAAPASSTAPNAAASVPPTAGVAGVRNIVPVPNVGAGRPLLNAQSGGASNSNPNLSQAAQGPGGPYQHRQQQPPHQRTNQSPGRRNSGSGGEQLNLNQQQFRPQQQQQQQPQGPNQRGPNQPILGVLPPPMSLPVGGGGGGLLSNPPMVGPPGGLLPQSHHISPSGQLINSQTGQPMPNPAQVHQLLQAGVSSATLQATFPPPNQSQPSLQQLLHMQQMQQQQQPQMQQQMAALMQNPQLLASIQANPALLQAILQQQQQQQQQFNAVAFQRMHQQAAGMRGGPVANQQQMFQQMQMQTIFNQAQAAAAAQQQQQQQNRVMPGMMGRGPPGPPGAQFNPTFPVGGVSTFPGGPGGFPQRGPMGGFPGGPVPPQAVQPQQPTVGPNGPQGPKFFGAPQPPPTNGLSAGPGVPVGGVGVISPVVPVVAEPVRKPLAIFDPDTGTVMDFSDIAKPKKSTASAPAKADEPTSSPTLAATASTSASSATGKPSELDLSESIPTGPSERKPLAIVSPTTYAAELKSKSEAVTATPATANDKESNAATTNATATNTTPATLTTSVSAPTLTLASGATATTADTSSAATSSSTVTSSSPSLAAPTPTPAPAVPYAPVTKRPLMSLSPQPGAGSGLTPSASSESLAALRRANENASPAPNATPATASTPAASNDSNNTAVSDDKDDSTSSRKRGPILPLSGGASDSKAYRATGSATKPPRPTVERTLKTEAATSTPVPEAATATTPVTPAAVAAAKTTPAVEGARVVNGRTFYDRDFLLTFAHIMERPYNFPSALQAEIEVRSSRGSASPGPRKALGGSLGGGSGGEEKWARLGPLTPASGQDIRRNMAPQGRGAFAQAQASAVRADQRNREVGGIGRDMRDKPRDGGRDVPRAGVDSRDDRRGGPARGPRDSRDSRDGRGGSDRRGGGGGPSYLEGPVAPLTKSENRWLPGAGITSDMDRIKKKLQGLLNKLAIDKFDTLTHQLTDLIVENKNEGVALLVEVVGIIFDKALGEQFFSSMYADLCVEVSKAVSILPEFEGATDVLPTGSTEGLTESEIAERKAKMARKSPFRMLLLNKCQAEFEQGIKPIERADMNLEEIRETEMMQKRRFLGNVKFIGELFKKGMLIEKIMHTCIRHLIGDLENPNEEDLEAVCNLLITIGKTLDHEKAQTFMNSYFERFVTFSKNKQLSSRTRFMCLDLIDLRRSGWNSRRKPQEVKSLDAVRQEAALEAQNKAAAAANARSTSGFGNRGASMPLRPTSMLSRGPIGGGSQDVRGVVTKKDRYASIGKPTMAPSTTPNTTTSTPTPVTPTFTITKDMLAATAASKTPQSAAAAASSSVKKSSTSSSSPDGGRSLTPIDTEKYGSIIRSLISEYISARKLDDARQTIEESRLPGDLIVHEAVVKYINDSKNGSAIAELCTELFQNGVLQFDNFTNGIISGLGTFDADFISDDMPRFAEIAGGMIALWVEARCIDVRIIEQSTRHLIECGESIKVFIHTVKALDKSFAGRTTIARTIIESGGINTIDMMGGESMTENLQERGRAFRAQPVLVQIYPTAPYEYELRQAITSSIDANSSDAFSAFLGSHTADQSSENFLRSIVESILSVTLSRQPIADTILSDLFTALRRSLTSAPSVASQVGVLHTLMSFTLVSNEPSGLVKRIIPFLQSSGLISAPSSNVVTVCEDEKKEFQIETPKEFEQAMAMIQ